MASGVVLPKKLVDILNECQDSYENQHGVRPTQKETIFLALKKYKEFLEEKNDEKSF